MENTGEHLKQEREKQQKTVREIVSSTRISKTVIEAIEGNDYASLPPLQYLKGLLRIYAKELNLDEQEIIEGYERAFQGSKISEFKVIKEIESTRSGEKKYGYYFIIILLLALAAGMYVVQNYYEESKKTFQKIYPEIEPEIISESLYIEEFADIEEQFENSVVDGEKHLVEEEPVITEEAPGGDSEEVDKKFVIHFSAEDLTWIRIEVDDKPSFEIMLRSGESYLQSAQKKMDVRLGNSGGVSLFFNDNPVKINGAPGKPIDLVFPGDELSE